MQQCSVRVELGSYVLRGREVELVEVTQQVGAHAHCGLTFDRDARVPGPVAALRLGDLTDARVRVVIVGDGDNGTEGFECLAFEGQVRKADAIYQSTGIARFSVSALSASYVLGEHVDRSYRREHTVAQLAQALGAKVAGSLPDGEPRDYVQPGRSAWATLGLAAAGEGLQLRPVWPRSPSDPAPPRPAEVAVGFADTTHTLVWGRNLLGFSTSVAPTNPGVTGAFYDPTAKHDHRYVVRARPKWLGGAAPVVSAAERAAETDANGGEPGHVEVGAAGGMRARTLAEFRSRLERESARRLGMSVIASGWSIAPGLRAGDKIDLWASSAAAAGQLSESGADGSGEGSGDESSGSAAGGGPYAPGAWVNGPEDADRTGVFGVIQVTHRWNGGLYENQFTATPWADYSPAPVAAAAGAHDGAGHASPARNEGGLALAIVTDNADPKHRGRVKVRYAWMSEGSETAWVRVAAPGAGNGRGLGWLPHKGDEVVVAAVAGDPEHPVVLGALWNGVDRAAHAPGLTHLITPGGNRLSFAEGKAGENKEVVELHTREGKTGVQLSANGGSPVVTVYSDGDISLEAPKGQVRISAKSMLTHVEQDARREVKGVVADEVGGDRLLHVKGRLALVSDGQFDVAAKAMLTHAPGGHTFVGQNLEHNPGGGAAPKADTAVPAAAASLWGPRSVPGPGPGVSTEDPRSRAKPQRPAEPAPKEKDVIDPQWTSLDDGGTNAPAPSGATGGAQSPTQTPPKLSPEQQKLHDIKALLQQSATGKAALQTLDAHKVPVTFKPGGGSYWNGSKIVIDQQQPTELAALTLVHEANHAEATLTKTTGNTLKQTRQDYVATMLREEAVGTVHSIMAKHELVAAGVPITATFPLEGAYDAAAKQAVTALTQKDSTIAAAAAAAAAGQSAGLARVLQGFQDGEVVASTTGQSYPALYGGYWDGDHPPKKP